MRSIFRAWFLLPHGYGGPQTGTKIGSGFGTQFLMNCFIFFLIWGVTFSDNFGTLAPYNCVYGLVLYLISSDSSPLHPCPPARRLPAHQKGSVLVFGVLHPRCVLILVWSGAVAALSFMCRIHVARATL